MAKTEPVLRKSLFIGVPPFINFVPGGGFPGEVIRGPQYWDHDNWDQDQLWRVALAMARWIEVIMIKIRNKLNDYNTLIAKYIPSSANQQ